MKLFQSILLSSIVPVVLAADILSSTGFINCESDPSIQVNSASITFDRDTGNITFDISGTNKIEQNVMAELTVTAYGQQVYSKSFNPCDNPKITHLCPVPAGTFSANGNRSIGQDLLKQIPSTAFTIPDLEGQATLILNGVSNNGQLGCIETGISNGKTVDLPAVTYAAAGIALAALAASGFASLGSASLVGTPAPAVTFSMVLGWFQTIQRSGMYSVNYPPVYQAFSENFAFSSGLIPWHQMQVAIDNFRASTGGSLTDDNVQFLQTATLNSSPGSAPTSIGLSTSSASSSMGLIASSAPSSAPTDSIPNSVLSSAPSSAPSFTGLSISSAPSSAPSSTSLSFTKRGLEDIFIRDLRTSVDTSVSSNDNVNQAVYGIGRYVEQKQIPQGNAFMTVLLILAIVFAAIIVGILLSKAILEAWARFRSLPKRLVSFRKRYRLILVKTLTSLITMLYGTTTVWCIYQFTNGDSWPADILAAVTLALFTGVLAFFAIKIVMIARKFKREEGDSSSLYLHKETWLKYSSFYNPYKQDCWWVFIPVFFYTFIQNCLLAGTNALGSSTNDIGLVQTSIQLVIEILMLILLVWKRPLATKSSHIIGMFVQVMQAFSVLCILLFVDKLGIPKTAQTIAGIVLISVQAGVSGILAILTTANALIKMCRENPHRKKRKEAERLSLGFDNLADTRDSALVEKLNLKDIESALSSHPNKSNAHTIDSKSGKVTVGGTKQPPPSVSIKEVSQTDRSYIPSIKSNTGDQRKSRQSTISITALQRQDENTNIIANDEDPQTLLPERDQPEHDQPDTNQQQ